MFDPQGEGGFSAHQTEEESGGKTALQWEAGNTTNYLRFYRNVFNGLHL